MLVDECPKSHYSEMPAKAALPAKVKPNKKCRPEAASFIRLNAQNLSA
jgi:hypothetical protein